MIDGSVILAIRCYLDELGREHGEDYIGAQQNKYFAKRDQGVEPFSFENHIEALIYSQLSAMTRFDRVDENREKIDKAFGNYSPEFIRQHSADYFVSALKEIGVASMLTRKQMGVLHDNLATLERIDHEFGGIDAFVTSRPAYEIIEVLSQEGKYKIKQISKALAAEYLSNVGIDRIKPDVHVVRFFERFCGIDTAWEIWEVATGIKEATGLTLTEIDQIIWNYCRPDAGDICGADPNCTACVVSESCEYYQKGGRAD
jgi:endonuclease III